MKLPTPAELGLPEKFADTGWRPIQEQALRWLLTRQNRVKALCAPTGAGKSLIAVAYALITGQPTAYVTETRSLQDQALHDFQSIGMVDLRGRRNYPCGLRDDYTCEDGKQARCLYQGTANCPSSLAEMRAATSPLVVTNYAKWTSAKKAQGSGLSHIRQVVFDEGHETVDAISRAMRVVIHHREREKDICMDPPATPDLMVAWKVWAVEARALVEGALKEALDRLRTSPSPKPTWVRHALHMRHLYRRLGILATCNPDNWVVEEFDGGFIFDAVRPGRYAESSLLLRLPNVLVVSATLRPKTLYMIGQGKDTFDYIEYDSEFPKERNPIYWVPTMRVDKRATDLSPLWLKMDQIAAKRRDRNGIIHTVSYARRDDIIGRSRFADSMFVNERGEAPTEMVETFKEAAPGAILVSPSVGQGHDFPGPACEWQLLCKVPFPPPSKILKARTDDDPEYPGYLAMQKMVQTFGRGMRFKEDQCENFICDDHVEWFVPRYGHLAPRSFHMFLRRADVLPQPPPALPR